MWLIHPKGNPLINLDNYADIRKCGKNNTHVDFYIKSPGEDRGLPDYTVIFESEAARNDWFDRIVRAISIDLSLYDEYKKEEVINIDDNDDIPF